MLSFYFDWKSCCLCAFHNSEMDSNVRFLPMLVPNIHWHKFLLLSSFFILHFMCFFYLCWLGAVPEVLVIMYSFDSVSHWPYIGTRKIYMGVCTGGLHNYCCVMMLCTFKLFLQMRYWCSLLVKNQFVCVRASTAKQILFLNHRNRKVVGGKYNVLVHWRNVGVSNPSGFVLCNPSK